MLIGFHKSQIILIILLLISSTTSLRIRNFEIDEENNSGSASHENEGTYNQIEEQLGAIDSYEENNGDDNDDERHKKSFDFYKDKQYDRSVLDTRISANTRQILIDILQKAIDQGWRPNLKQYIPGTRFGRHRR